ncbi:MAG TPA: amino acid adenylation domain-containing protein [Pyrinomonadaceae bacterium]|jgi:amino acid adenylation domain-containing protein
MKKNITIIFLANFFALLSGVVTSLLTAWALGPEGRGDLAIIVLYPNIVALAVGLGMPQATRFCIASEPEKTSSLFSNAVIFAAGMGVLAYVAAEFVVPTLIGVRSEAVMWLVKIYLINIPFALLYDLMAGMLEGSRQFKWAALARIVFFGIQSAAYFVLWISGHLTVYTAAFTMIAAQLANTFTAVFSVLYVLKPVWKPSWAAWKEAVGFGLKYHVGVVTSFTTLRLDQMMLGGMATSIEMGLYVIAVRISEITTVLASSVSEVLMPEVAASKKSEDSINLLLRSLRQTFYVYLLILVPLLLFAPLILEYCFGAEFAAASGALRLLLVASMLWSAGAIVNSGLNGFGYPGLSTISRLSSAIVTVFAVLYWLPRYGIVGAALSSLVGYGVMFAVALFWLLRKKDIRLSEVFTPRLEDIPMKKFMTIIKSRTNIETRSISTNLQKDYCFHQLFEQQAAEHPDRTAIICNGKQLSYGELNARANQLAAHLRSRGVVPETLIPICVDRSIEMAIGILGILKSGAAYVPIDPAYPAERIEFMLSDTSAPFIVTQSIHSLASGTEKILLDADWEIIAQNPTDNPLPLATSENLAYVIYTSGSTGRPKGAMLTHGNLCHYVQALQEEFRLTPADRYLHLASIAFSSSRRHMLFPLAHGASVVIADEEQRMDPLPLFELVKEQSVTIFDAVPSFQRHCMNALLELESECREELLDNNLRLVVSASEPLLSDIPATWMYLFKHPAQHIHMIGQTETSGIISLNRITPEDITSDVKPVSVGRPIANTKIYLLDENQQPIAPGEAGEMYVWGKGLGRGYLNRPELNAQKFVELKVKSKADPEKYLLQRVCRTGDFARLLPDGRLECLGRQDFQVKIRGQRVELGEIEALFISHSDVRECAVIGREDQPGQIRLTAYIVAARESETILEELRALAKEKLPDYMQPSAFMVIDALPLTPNGKVDRKSLPRPDDSAFVTPENYAAPRNSVEQAIADIWAKVLDFNRVGIDDNFFELGGHSLLASRVISRLRSAFDVEIPLRAIFEAPTVAELSEKINYYRGQSNAISTPAISRTERPELIPLSFAQQRLWFLAQMEDDSSTYNMSEVVRLKGNLETEILRSALENIFARHEILRTSFKSINGQPSQFISSEACIDLSVTNLVDFSAEMREEEAKKIAGDFAATPFDLANCPLLRLKLIKLDEAEHILVIVFHHIISDGWSVGLFLKELSAFYEARLSGSEDSVEDLPIQYADYAIWQQEWLQTEQYDEQLQFWKKQLEGAPALLELPTDFPRPAVQRFQGTRCSVYLSSELTEKINSLSKQQGATLYMTLLSAWQILLSRYTGQDQIVVGTPIAGRTMAETENLIGFFVNTLALRGDLSGEITFQELLQRNKERALGAYANQEMPFEKLVEEINPERSLSYAPIFQVMFALQNAPSAGENFAGLKLNYEKLTSQSAKFDLSLDVFEEADGSLELQLEYDTDLFAEQTAEQILGNFRTILEAAAENPEQRLTNIPLLTARERQQMLIEWNRFDAEVPPVCLHQLFEAHAERTPDATAVVWNNERLSYGELNARANQLAQFLRKQGVKPETIVGVYVERSFEMIIGVLGVLKAGGAYLPLDSNYPSERLQHMVGDAGVSLLITQENLKSKTSEFSVDKIFCLDSDWSEISNESVQNPETDVTQDSLAYVIFTSGSTGKSKGAMITHGNVVSAYAGWEDAYNLSSIRSHIQMASFSFDVFTGDLTRAFGSGAALVLCPTEFLLEPEKLERLMRDEKTECGDFVPAVMRPLIEYLENTNQRLDYMKVVSVGADIWQMEEYRRLKRVCTEDALVVNSYGITETTIDSTFFEPNEKDQLSEGIIPIGRPYANTKLYVLDANQNLVPARVPGELYIGGNGVGRGYLNRPELTKEKFIEWTAPAELESGDPGATKLRLYKTGDLARYRHDGMIEILGRADYQVKLRGYRVELGEIEAVVSRHPDVNECIVALREDVPGDKRLVAYVTAKVSEIDAGDMRRFVKSFLPEYMVPSAFVLMKEWKLTPNGKIDRKQLPVPDETFAETEYVAPRTPIEEKLASIWASLLSHERIGVNDNFFDLGGHSLLATQIVSRIRDAFGKNIPLRMLFETPTIAGLAQQIISLNGLAFESAIERESNYKELPLSCAQQRLWFLEQFDPENCVYNLPAVWRINGAIDSEVLERSVNEIIARHEILRTTYSLSNDQPVQLVAESFKLPLEIVELEPLSAAERDAAVEDLIREKTNEPFDLLNGPLMRNILISLGENEHFLVLVFHHSISDGWSIELFLKELSALYNAKLSGVAASLPELSIQYADYALWQQKWLESEDYKRQLDFWKHQLKDAPTFLELPTDYPRPALQRYRGAQCSARLSADLTEQINALSREEGVTLFMTLLSAWQVLLWRYSGQDQLVVGSPIAGRTKTETENLIGFFVNTLALRGDLSGDPTFRELLQRTKESALGAYANQEMPFEKLIEEINPERSLSFTPLFQVMFSLETASSTTERFANLNLSRVKLPSQTAKFDLSLDVFEKENELTLWLEYDIDLFKTETVEKMLAEFQSLLETIVYQPESRLIEFATNDFKRREERENSFVSLKTTRNTDFIPLQTPTEKIVGEIWENVLRQKEIGAESDFFDLGGHSLLALKVIMRLRAHFDLEIPLRYIFEHSTIKSFSAKIDEMQQEKQNEELDTLLAELENISDEEVERLIAEEANSSYLY